MKKGTVEIYPDFKVGRSKDLMTRGRAFYAIWDEEKGIWSTDEYDVQRLVDAELWKYRNEKAKSTDDSLCVKLLSDFSSNSWSAFRSYLNHISDNATQLDSKLVFANAPINKNDFVSKRLSYPLIPGKCDAYDELIGTLYHPEERAKLEWAIGAIVSGDSKTIQKFIVLHGATGAGKSTIINIIQKLFDGHWVAFDAKALTSANNSFAMEAFKTNPLVAIQHDGDLSRIEDNTKLNSIISHEDMTVNEKFKPSYTAKTNRFLFLGTNKPVKITDAKSGIIRRLIDVTPTGQKVSPDRYQVLVNKIDFELGAIASHCLEVYRDMGKNYYATYSPMSMILQTDIFFNFVEDNFEEFKQQDGVSLRRAFDMYKAYCDEALIEYKMQRHKFREELKSYFYEFSELIRIDGKQQRSYYSGFNISKFVSEVSKPEEKSTSLTLDSTISLLDDFLENEPAQYATKNGVPIKKWDKVNTTLSKIDTSKVHYVQPTNHHIVIDFDLTDSDGNKALDLNIDAAAKWPHTYSEVSKSGNGLHLHYIYDDDATKLSRVFSEGIEIKVFNGDSSLRRRLTMCNDIPIATINSGLPLKGEKMINFDTVKSEQGLRTLIIRNLKKEIHAGTKPSIDFINSILDEAYETGLVYDLTNMRPTIMAFANNSTNQSGYCLKLVCGMKFKSEEKEEEAIQNYEEDGLVFFDVEVFPNLFVVVWKPAGKPCVRMINPTAAEIENILKFKLIGFNCRRYDNHMLYACYIGYNNAQLYKLSKQLISNSRNGPFAEAYNLSYTDVFEFSSKKQSLKKFEIELGIHHHELGYDWDEPVPEDKWVKVAEYCDNDVIATEETFNARSEDFTARLILAELSTLTPNHTTQNHAARILFGKDPKPQSKFEYTDLSEMFPGYKYSFGKSMYRGEEVSEGGYVYSEPGMYTETPLLDIESLHPNSLILMNAFGPYTKNFEDVVKARVAIKHGDVKSARTMLDGILKPFLTDESKESLDKLSYALKIVINIVYGMTSAKFDNKFRDPRNVDNIVAKRGALFMIDLKHAVQEQGFTVAHIKTDSIKIPNATPEIIKFVSDFGAKYGYIFDHEATYEKLCLVNDSVYISKIAWAAKEKLIGTWSATGAQFAQPYVYKTLFSKEAVEFKDMCETKSVSTSLHLDINEDLNDDEHNYRFVGKVGLFCPIKLGAGGGMLMREKEGEYHAASGTKGYRWLESETVQKLEREEDIDRSYYAAMVDAAVAKISKFGDFEWFVSDGVDVAPWGPPCGSKQYPDCSDCPEYHNPDSIVKCKKGFDIVPF